MSTVIFLHGLNTYNDNQLHVGPLTFGQMSEVWEREFEIRDYDFVGVTDLQGGSAEQQAEHTVRFLKDHGLLDPEAGSFHLVGHSIGGLVARVLAHRPELQGRVKSIISIGTPHHGTNAARLGLDIAHNRPKISRALKMIGYDTRKRVSIFEHFTPDALRAFNKRYGAIEGIRETALLCEVSAPEVAIHLLPMYPLLHPRDEDGTRPKSDGFILSESQKRGEILGPFAVDHVAQLGYFLQALPSLRRHAKAEFSRLIDTVCGMIEDR